MTTTTAPVQLELELDLGLGLEWDDPTPAAPTPGPLYVIPCSGAKLDHAAPAGALYVGSWHKLARAAADAAAARTGGRVMILSALHGLVDLDAILEPYDATLRDLTRKPGPGQVDRFPGGELPLIRRVALTLVELGVTKVIGLVPTGYQHVLECAELSAAIKGAELVAEFPLDGCAGVGYQRQRLARIRDGHPTD